MAKHVITVLTDDTRTGRTPTARSNWTRRRDLLDLSDKKCREAVQGLEPDIAAGHRVGRGPAGGRGGPRTRDGRPGEADRAWTRTRRFAWASRTAMPCPSGAEGPHPRVGGAGFQRRSLTGPLEYRSECAAITSIAAMLGIGDARFCRLKREVAELRRANEIRTAAAGFFRGGGLRGSPPTRPRMRLLTGGAEITSSAASARSQRVSSTVRCPTAPSPWDTGPWIRCGRGRWWVRRTRSAPCGPRR
jgi:hypothetical protein